MQNKKFAKSLILALCCAAAPMARAQVVTTSVLSGSIQSEQNQIIKGAKITVLHEPTGTVYNLTSRADGSFSLNGLRPGGPYKVTVNSPEGNAELNALFLEIDTGATVTMKVHAGEVIALEAFKVETSAMDQYFDASMTGSSTYVDSRQIRDLPAGDRSINALARLDPRISYNRDPQDRAISVSGLSNRYNQIQVDGVSASDPFGLNSNNSAAERNAIPLDSIEAVSINTTPYNARNGGFIGAQVNAITKSGTNQYHGSAYFNWRGNTLPLGGKELQMVGEVLDGTRYSLSKFDEQTMGVTLGGPILKKKLFFYVAYEKVDEDRPGYSPTTWVDATTLKQIIDKAKELGFSPGNAVSATSNKLKDDNIIAKLDWQINSMHRTSFRYSKSESSRPTFPNFGDGVSQNNFSLDSAWYKQEISNESYIGQLISTWSDSFSTELSISRSLYHSEPKNSSRQPYVEIRNVPVTGSSYTSYITFGTESSRHYNILDTKTNSAELFGTYHLNDKHTIQSGIQYDKADIFNAFVQYTYGYYRFLSLSDFLNKASTGGASGQYYYNKFNDGVDAAARFAQGNAGAFINDRWKITNTLSLDLGVRVDSPLLPDAVPFNQLFADTFGVRNDYTYNGKKIAQPRIGFNWQPALDRRTTIRGGVGLFYGRMPLVWMSNSYSNTGFNYTSYSSTTLPAISANPDSQPTTVASSAQQTVSFVKPGFQLPSRWKANFAVDRELGFLGLKASAEIEGTKVRNDVFYRNVNLAQTGYGPDNRVMYWTTAKAVTVTTAGAVSGGNSGNSLVSSKFTNRIMELGNTDQGQTQAVTISLERPYKADGWSWKAAYVNTHAEEVLYGTSSVAGSNWNNRAVFNTNQQELHRAELEIRHKLLFNLTKEVQIVKGHPTTFSFVYEGRSGYPFSFVSSNDTNGDSQSANDLIYVPLRSGDSKARFATAADQAKFYQIVDRFGLTEGQAVTANEKNYPWVNTFDIGVKQKIKLPGWRHHLTLGADILNVGNLLNSKWGLIRGSNQFFSKKESVATVTYDGVNNQYVYSNVSQNLATGGFAPSRGRGEPAATRWSVLLSAKYEF